MKARSLLPLLFGLVLAAPAPTVQASGGRIEAVAPGLTETSAFVTLRNSGPRPVQVTGGTTSVAGMVMPMQTVTKGSGTARMSGMVNVPALSIPARGTLTMTPDGDHLMLTGLKRPLKPGETVTLTLNLKPGGPLTVKLPVRKP